MHFILVLMAGLVQVYAPSVNITDAPNSNEIICCTSTIVISTSPIAPNGHRPTARPLTKTRKRPIKQGKSDSPMLNYIFDSYATSKKHFHDTFKAPSFEGNLDSDTELEADTGAIVFLDCRVTSLRDKKVSWLKVSDEDKLELLTIDLDTHTTDSRYRMDLSGDNWRLELSDVRVSDSGMYCCHVSTHPPMLRRVALTVHSPEILTSKETFLETGETLALKCYVRHLDPGNNVPQMQWFRGNNTKSLDELRGGVLIETDHLTLTSHLQVANLKLDDAGNYTCALEVPMQMRSTTRVHVLQGSSLAELQSGVKTTSSLNCLLMVVLISLFHKVWTLEFIFGVR